MRKLPCAASSLERMETMMAVGLAAPRGIRPAFGVLYAMLDDRQRKTLDEMAAHRAGS